MSYRRSFWILFSVNLAVEISFPFKGSRSSDKRKFGQVIKKTYPASNGNIGKIYELEKERHSTTLLECRAPQKSTKRHGHRAGMKICPTSRRKVFTICCRHQHWLPYQDCLRSRPSGLARRSSRWITVRT